MATASQSRTTHYWERMQRGNFQRRGSCGVTLQSFSDDLRSLHNRWIKTAVFFCRQPLESQILKACEQKQIAKSFWGGSSTGRARRSQCRGWEFDPPPLHYRDRCRDRDKDKHRATVHECPQTPGCGARSSGSRGGSGLGLIGPGL